MVLWPVLLLLLLGGAREVVFIALVVVVVCHGNDVWWRCVENGVRSCCRDKERIGLDVILCRFVVK